MMTPAEMVALLEEKYHEEYAAYQELLLLAGRVRQKLTEGADGEIEPLLAEQARLCGLVDRCEETVRVLRREAAPAFGCPELTLATVAQKVQEGHATLHSLGRTMAEVARVLQELAAVHADNQGMLEARLSSVRAERLGLERAKAAIHAYQPPTGEAPAPRFLDKRS
ncbi:MAG: hypothetical protein ACM3RP_03355 [Chitinophagales bacterium]